MTINENNDDYLRRLDEQTVYLEDKLIVTKSRAKMNEIFSWIGVKRQKIKDVLQTNGELEKKNEEIKEKLGHKIYRLRSNILPDKSTFCL